MRKGLRASLPQTALTGEPYSAFTLSSKLEEEQIQAQKIARTEMTREDQGNLISATFERDSLPIPFCAPASGVNGSISALDLAFYYSTAAAYLVGARSGWLCNALKEPLVDAAIF
jgi:hypothetical protein